MNIKRFFRDELPCLNDMVMVRVTREEEEYGYYCELLEYNNIEAFLPLSELVKTKYAKKHILKPNQILPMSVSRVEGSTGHINLTKKRVSNEESDTKKDIYRVCCDINKLVNECYIMYSIYQKKSDTDILEISDFMDQTIWNIYAELENDYPKIYQYILHNPLHLLPETIFSPIISTFVLNDISERITFTNKIIHLDLKLIVTDENPVTKIKQIMDLSGLIIPCTIKSLVITSPIYRIRIEGDFDDYTKIIQQIKNQIIQNSSNIKSILNFQEPKIEKEATCKLKNYADYDLANFSKI